MADRPLPRPGPTDSIRDVPGLFLGQLELTADHDEEPVTGVTAVVAPDGALGAVDVRGGAPGTRETDALSPLASGERCHAVLLVGRSVFGLAAADGAARELEARGIGIQLEHEGRRLVVPIVAAAVVFDFASGEDSLRPGAEDGRRVVSGALGGSYARPPSGRAGAGAGAWTGELLGDRRRGGAGHASLVVGRRSGRALVVGALVVVNSAGAAIDPATGRPWASGGGFERPAPVPDFSRISTARGQTTLAVVGTNARLSKAQLAQVAVMAHDGIARAIRPAHTGVDGDAVFGLAVPDASDHPAVVAHRWGPAAVSIVGALAADAVTRAILDALGARG